LNEYTCKYSLYHDKKVVGNEPRSNNGWLYSSIAKELGLPIDIEKLNDVSKACIPDDDWLYLLYRLPNKRLPPFSRDELVGQACLGVLDVEMLAENDWNVCKFRNLPAYSIKETFEALLYLKDKHRNTIWLEEVFEAYKFVFSVSPADRYFLKRVYKKPTSFFEITMFILYVASTMIAGGNGELNILWVQLRKLESKLFIHLINYKKSILGYFGPYHIFTKKVLADE